MPIQATLTGILPNMRFLPSPSPSAALQPVYLCSTNPSFPSTFFPNPLSLWPLCPHPQRPLTAAPAGRSPRLISPYLRHTRAPLLPPIPLPLPLPAQQLLPPSFSRPAFGSALLFPPPIKLCPACMSPVTPLSLSLGNYTCFSNPSTPSFRLFSWLRSAQPPPEHSSPVSRLSLHSYKGLLLFPLVCISGDFLHFLIPSLRAFPSTTAATFHFFQTEPPFLW